MKASAKIATSGRNIRTSSSHFNILDVGGADGSRARQTFPDCRIVTIDKVHGWDIEKKGLPRGLWDVIFANHIIEHLVDPDHFLDECKKVMQEHTVLEIGTPNLTAWFNRIFFLLGYVPHSVELSTRHNLGKPFDWNKEPLGGHIHVFTIPTLKELIQRHGFRIHSVTPEHSTFPCAWPIRIADRALTNLNPNLASAFRVRCTLRS